MTVLTMPDGQAVDFGDMAPDQIKAIVQKRYPDWKPPPPAQGQPYKGQLLPFSKDAEGNVSFDINAGLPGMIKRAVEFPAAAMRGEIDPLSDEGIARAVEAGAIMTPVGAATRGGLGWAGAGRAKPKVKTPTGKELLETGDYGFNLARQMDVRYDPRAVQNMVLKLRSQLHAAGFRKSNAERSFAELDELSKPFEPGSFASIDDLHAVRMALGKAAQNFNNPTDQDAAVQIIKAIDDFISNPDPKAVVAGPAAAAGAVWRDAMGNYAAGKRSDKLVDKPFSLEERAVRRTNATNSGLNQDNTIRQRVASLLDNPKTRAGFSAEEIALLETVANGTAARNVTRFIGNLLGGGGGLAAVVTGLGSGMLTGSKIPALVGAGVVGTGIGAKVAANHLTKRALNKAAQTVRQRSPLYEARLAASPAPPPLTSPGTRSAMGRVVMGEATGKADKSAIFEELEKNRITPQEYEEYLRLKYAPQQGA